MASDDILSINHALAQSKQRQIITLVWHTFCCGVSRIIVPQRRGGGGTTLRNVWPAKEKVRIVFSHAFRGLTLGWSAIFYNSRRCHIGDTVANFALFSYVVSIFYDLHIFNVIGNSSMQ